MGFANADQGTVIEYVFPGGVVNNPGDDLVVFELHYDVGAYNVSTDWDGFADVGDARHSFDELVSAGHAKKSGSGYEIPMSEDTRLVVDVDGVIFFAHNVHRGRRIIARLTEDVDYPFLAIFSSFGGSTLTPSRTLI